MSGAVKLSDVSMSAYQRAAFTGLVAQFGDVMKQHGAAARAGRVKITAHCTQITTREGELQWEFLLPECHFTATTAYSWSLVSTKYELAWSINTAGVVLPSMTHLALFDVVRTAMADTLRAYAPRLDLELSFFNKA